MTNNLHMGLWLLKDGRLVNGSYENRQRDIDHHEISQYFKQSKLEDPGSSEIYIWKFERRGNIRWSCSETGYYFEMAKLPTIEQMQMLNRAIRFALTNHIPIGFGRRMERHKTIYEHLNEYMKYLNHYAPDKAAYIESI